MFPSILLTTLLIIYTTNSEIVYCDGSETASCGCFPSAPTPGETCILNCARTDTCKASILNCREGHPCVVQCTTTSSCADYTVVNGNAATDVSVICDGIDACKTGMNIRCGTGDCNLHCGDGTSCEKFGSIDISHARSFSCTNCPKGIDTLQFTSYPTSNPTIKPTDLPTILPTADPTKYPTLPPIATPTSNPTFDPITDPTYRPTYHPTSNPTFNPSVIHIYDPTNDPTKDSTTDPTSDPTFNPTNDPTKDLTIDLTPKPSFKRNINPTIKPSFQPTNSYILSTDSQELESMMVESNEWDYGDIVLSISLLVFCVSAIVIYRMLSLYLKNREANKMKDIEGNNLMQIVNGNPTNIKQVYGDDGDGDSYVGDGDGYDIICHLNESQFEYKLKGFEGQTSGGIWNENTYKDLQNIIATKFDLKYETFNLYELVDGDVIDIDDIDDIMNGFDCVMNETNQRIIHIFVEKNGDGECSDTKIENPLCPVTRGEKVSISQSFRFGSHDITILA